MIVALSLGFGFDISHFLLSSKVTLGLLKPSVFKEVAQSILSFICQFSIIANSNRFDPSNLEKSSLMAISVSQHQSKSPHLIREFLISLHYSSLLDLFVKQAPLRNHILNNEFYLRSRLSRVFESSMDSVVSVCMVSSNSPLNTEPAETGYLSSPLISLENFNMLFIKWKYSQLIKTKNHSSSLGTQKSNEQNEENGQSMEDSPCKIAVKFLQQVLETPFKLAPELVTAPFQAKLSHCCANIFAMHAELLEQKVISPLFDMAFEFLTNCQNLFSIHRKGFMLLMLQTATKALEWNCKVTKNLGSGRRQQVMYLVKMFGSSEYDSFLRAVGGESLSFRILELSK